MRLSNKVLPLAVIGLLPALVHGQAPPSTSAAPKELTNPQIQYDTRNGFNLAFVDADVRRVVDAVLGSMLEFDYSVDPSVQGNITLRTRQPVTKESLIPLLESALRSVDAVLLVQGNSYRVVPRSEARNRAPLSRVADAGTPSPGYATDVVTLRNGSARDITRLLEQFLGKDVVAGVNNPLNQIIISGSGEERAAARELVQRFDVDTLAQMNFELYRLENVDPDTLTRELERVFQPPFDIIGSRVRLVPLGRLRSVLAIAVDRADIARIEPWIRRLDTGGSGKRKVYSYSVQNGRARDIASSLQLVLGGSATDSTTPAEEQNVDVGASEIDSSTLTAEPSDVIASQTPLPGSSQTLVAGGGNGPRIVPNDHNNSLLIFANGEEYEFIRDVLQKIDQPVSQVLIEATLAEVTLTDDFRFGVNFRAFNGNDTITNSGVNVGVPTSIFPGFSLSLIGASAEAVLNTLQSKTNVRVLSAPKLIVLNNQTATLQVGDQVPIVTQQAQSVSAPGAPIVNSVELRDTGVILKVTPRVNESGTITLDIAQEVSDVAPTTTAGINTPTIQQRRLATSVSTRTGQMIALGGLIRDRMTQTKSGIPFLSQIPIIGGLFGTQGNMGARTELIILLTPTIIRSPDEVRGIVDALIDGLDATQPLVNRARQGQVSEKFRQ